MSNDLIPGKTASRKPTHLRFCVIVAKRFGEVLRNGWAELISREDIVQLANNGQPFPTRIKKDCRPSIQNYRDFPEP